MADILDFRDVTITGDEKANYLLENVSGAIMYFKDATQSSSLKSILSSGAAWASKEYYDGASEIQTIQEFEQKGNTALGHFGNN